MSGMARPRGETEATAATAATSASPLVPQLSAVTEATALTAGAPGARGPVKDLHPWGDLRGFRNIAEGLADATKARVSTVNRVERGGTADLIQGEEMITMAQDLEKRYREMLMGKYATVVPAHVREWAAGIPGIATGELFPKLLGFIGHPRIAIPWHWEESALVPGEPYYRSLRELWSWCGCGDPARNPRDLVKRPPQEQVLACGKRTQVRPVLHVFSSYLVTAGTPVTKDKSKFLGRPRSEKAASSPFFLLFQKEKEEGAAKVHQWPCQNHKLPKFSSNGCGTVAHPEWGEPGSPWRPGHAQAHAHRMVHKEFLRQLWEISEL